MDMREAKLPWQFVLLGFLAFGAFCAGAILIISLIPFMEMGPLPFWVRVISITYLVVAIGVTPYLLRTGKPGFDGMNPTDAAGQRKIPPVSPEKQIGISVITLVAGVMMSVFSYTNTGATIGGYYRIHWGLMLVGLIGIVFGVVSSFRRK